MFSRKHCNPIKRAKSSDDVCLVRRKKKEKKGKNVDGVWLLVSGIKWPRTMCVKWLVSPAQLKCDLPCLTKSWMEESLPPPCSKTCSLLCSRGWFWGGVNTPCLWFQLILSESWNVSSFMHTLCYCFAGLATHQKKITRNNENIQILFCWIPFIILQQTATCSVGGGSHQLQKKKN